MNDHDWDNLIIGEAAKWFPECEDILIWRWNARDPRECHPLNVVRAWEEKLEYPTQVAVAADVFLQELLEKEWERSGMGPETIPVLVPHADSTGRRAWRINLADAPEGVRLSIGRAAMDPKAVECRSLRDDVQVAEEDLIPWKLAMELAIAYRKQPGHLPDLPGVFWRIIDQK